MNPETKICQNCKNDFNIEPDDFSFYQKIKVPPPTWCWKCRAMRRMSFRNMTRLYPRVCAATGKKIFSFMPPTAPMPVYEHDYWSSDGWDPMQYGKDYDFSKPFLEQFRDLYHAVPWTNVHSFGSVNSEYSSAIFSKNCYLCFDSGYAEDSAYSVTLQKSKQCFDIINCKNCELCYFTINTSKSYKVFFSRNCSSCNDVWFSDDCIGCSNCVGCIRLRNKSYYIFNQSYSKEEYEQKIKGMKMDSYSGLKDLDRKVKSFWITQPVKYQHGIKSHGCTGDYLFNTSELRNCFFSDGAQNCANSQSIIYDPIKDCADVTSSGLNIQNCYEIVCSGEGLSNVYLSFDVMSLTNSQYTTNCRSSNNLFGCVGIRGKDYCILNKQYTKDEYNALLPRIIQQMNDMPYIDSKGRIYKYGEFLPPEMSPYGYNVTQGQEYFPITKDEARHSGFNWEDEEERSYKATKSPQELPETISGINNDILNEVITCEHAQNKEHPWGCDSNCATAFRIIPEELQFYQKMNLPLPRLCYQCRHFQLISYRNKPQLYYRSCMCDKATHSHEGKCEVEFETSYAPERPEIVYCEKCYQQEVA